MMTKKPEIKINNHYLSFKLTQRQGEIGTSETERESRAERLAPAAPQQ